MSLQIVIPKRPKKQKQSEVSQLTSVIVERNLTPERIITPELTSVAANKDNKIKQKRVTQLEVQSILDGLSQ